MAKNIRTNTLFRVVAMLLALICAMLFAMPVNAEVNHRIYLDDIHGMLTDSEETVCLEIMNSVAQNVGIDVGIVITDRLSTDTDTECYADDLRCNIFGEKTDSIMLVINNSNNGYADWIATGGKARDLYDNKIEKLYDEFYEGLDTNGYFAAINMFCHALEEIAGVSDGSTEPEGYEPLPTYKAVLEDLDDVLTDSEEKAILEVMQETAEKIEIHIGIIISDDLEGMSDRNYTEAFMDRHYAYDASVICLLYNNDRSNMNYVDWISTSGKARNYYDNKIDKLFDYVYDGLGEDDYYRSIEYFCDSLQEYAYESFGSNDLDYDIHYEGSLDITFLFPGIAISAITTIIIVAAFTSGYKKKKPVSAAVYLDNNRIRFTHRSDVFVREYTTSHTVSSSSSGGRSGGGGGRSRSSGRGGGGGRRR